VCVCVCVCVCVLTTKDEISVNFNYLCELHLTAGRESIIFLNLMLYALYTCRTNRYILHILINLFLFLYPVLSKALHVYFVVQNFSAVNWLELLSYTLQSILHVPKSVLAEILYL
jgi:Na+/melibiose symporter-like transporter